MSTIEFRGITVTYNSRPGARAVLDEFDLTVRDGEFMVLVGPSGCGKTTALRVVAGLLRPTSGRVLLDGEDVTNVAPADRDLAMVFQSYALYPHMTVRDNMAFGLRLAHVNKRERAERVRRAAEILGLTDLLDRRPRELSGGQRQRVAMGRAIVREPRAFLMDEPLSNLDAKLRVRMRAEIARIQRDLGTTTLYVTHDQVEAMTMADRIAVLHDGRLQQLGTPDDLFRRPANMFVAAFIGSPPTNFLPAHATTDLAPDPTSDAVGATATALRIGDRLLPLPDELAAAVKAASSPDLLIGIRPHDVETDPAAAGDGALRLDLAVDLVERLGTETLAHGEVATSTTSGAAAAAAAALVGGEESLALPADRRRFTAALDARFPLTAPTTLSLYVPLDRLHLFDAETGATLLAAERSLVGA